MYTTIQNIKEKLPLTKTIRAYQGSYNGALMAFELKYAIAKLNVHNIPINGKGFYFKMDTRAAETSAMKMSKAKNAKSPSVFEVSVKYKKAFDLRKLYTYYQTLKSLAKSKGVASLSHSDQKQAARRAFTSIEDIKLMEELLPKTAQVNLENNSTNGWNLSKRLMDKGYDLIYLKQGNAVALTVEQIQIIKKHPINVTLYQRLEALKQLDKSHGKSKGWQR